MFDELIRNLETGRMEPISFWYNHASKWDYDDLLKFYIRIIGITAKEEREGRYDSTLHRHSKYLSDYLSQKLSIQNKSQNNLNQKDDSRNINEDIQNSILFQNQEIKAVIETAIEKKFMDKDGNWFLSQALLAIFCQRIYFKYIYATMPYHALNPDDTPKKEWKHFQGFFRIKNKEVNLRDAFKKAKKCNTKNLFLIDGIIEETPEAKEDREKDHS